MCAKNRARAKGAVSPPQLAEERRREHDRMAMATLIRRTSDRGPHVPKCIEYSRDRSGRHERLVDRQDEQPQNSRVIDDVDGCDDRRDLTFVCVMILDEAHADTEGGDLFSKLAVFGTPDDQNVSDARVPQHLGELSNERGAIRACWQERFGSAHPA